MRRIKYSLLCIGTICGFTAFAVPTLAQDVPATAPSAVTSPSEREYEFLKEQQHSFREFVQQERTELREQQGDVIGQINLMLVLLTALGAALGILLGLLNWKSRRDIKAIVKEQFEDAIQAEVRRQGSTLKAQIERELQSLERRIIVVAAEEDIPSFEALELRALQDRGFKHISVRTTFNGIKPADSDLVVYWYRSTVKDQPDTYLGQLVTHLKGLETTLPLIVYTFRKSPTLNGVDWDNLRDNYPMSYIANMPLSLITNIFSTLNAFYPPEA